MKKLLALSIRLTMCWCMGAPQENTYTVYRENEFNQS